MKFIVIIIFSLSFCFQTQAQKNLKEITKGDTLKVFVNSGLNLRDAPNGNKIKTIKYGSSVVVQAVTTTAEKIEKRSGIWVRVETVKGIEGYVFSGFTTKLHVPDLKSDQAHCNPMFLFRRWMEEMYSDVKVLKTDVIHFSGNSQDSSDMAINSVTTYENGIVTSEIMENGYLRFTLESYELSTNDLINLFDSIKNHYTNSYCKDFNPTFFTFGVNTRPMESLVFTSKSVGLKVYRFGNKMICSYSIDEGC